MEQSPTTQLTEGVVLRCSGSEWLRSLRRRRGGGLRRRTYCASALVSIGLCAACGGDDLAVDNVTARGSVGGIVFEAETRSPLAAAQASVFSGGFTFGPVTTADDGGFRLEEVPAGDVLISIVASGFHDAWLHGLLPESAGEFPAGNSVLTVGPLGLISSASSFRLRVLDDDGTPAGGYGFTVVAPIQYLDLSSSRGRAIGETVFQTTTDSDGFADVLGMPDFFSLGSDIDDTVRLLLPPHDRDGDGTFEYAGGLQTLRMRRLRDPTPDVILDPMFAASLKVRASTVRSFVEAEAPATVIPFDGAISITFNLPIEDTSTVEVVDEVGTPVSPPPAITVAHDTLTIDFGGAGSLGARSEYNLVVHAVAASTGGVTVVDLAAPFFTASSDSVVTITEVTRDASSRVSLVLSEPIGLGLPDGALLSPDCVVFYNQPLGSSVDEIVGDSPGELLSDTCWDSFTDLVPAEPDPVGLVGKSGYTTRWQFSAPSNASASMVHLIFDRVTNPERVMHRPDGRAVDTIVFTMPERP